MLINTHRILAINIFEQANEKKLYLINEKRFIWGNIKPDCTSKYKFKKHYYKESIDMIMEKIEFLSGLSVSDIYFDYGKGKFSEEIGVVCHFLCDYFCLPHNKRWEFKNAMKKHMQYENGLAKFIKEFENSNYIDSNLSVNDIREFIDVNLERYEDKIGYRNDLNFAYYVCNSILNTMLNTIFMNEYNENNNVG